MRIACLIDHLGSGGAQRQLVTLAVAFHQLGHDVRVVTYADQNFYLPLLQENGIRYERTPKGGRLRRILAVRRVLRHGDHDVVLAFLETPALLAELAALPGRDWGLVVSERTSNPESFRSLRGRYLRWMHTVADFITVNANATKELIDRLYPRLRGRVHVVFNTVDLTRFFPVAERHSPDRRPRTIAVAASYHPRKNVDGLLRAIAMLDGETRKRLRVEWYGDRHGRVFEDAMSFVRSASLDGCVRLEAATLSIAQIMQRVDAVGLFSHAEGLPNAICEAMACGKPVLLTRVSDATLLVRQGINGWLCYPDNPASIAEALQSFVGARPDELEEMGRESRRLAESLFDPKKIVGDYLTLLARASGARRRLCLDRKAD